MLKSHESLKNLEARAAELLREVLGQVPVVEQANVFIEEVFTPRGPDVVVQVEAYGKRRALVCEVKSSAQPRQVRTALLQLRDYQVRLGNGAIPVLIAPYLSPAAQMMCREQGVGFLDFEGNVHLAFDGVFIDRQVTGRPVAAKRELRSIFKPKSAQVLRVLLQEPGRSWRVVELARAAGVSLGHVSNVRTGLLDREWAQIAEGGLQLSRPDALLDAWGEAYEPPPATRMHFYTTLHGSALDDAARSVLSKDGPSGLAIYSSFSAAQWLAPYGRTGVSHFYADEAGLERLKPALKLSPVAKGENVVVAVLKDTGIFTDAVEPAPRAYSTSPVQTYLDLADAGERGREAADHLRREKLTWAK